MHYREPFFKELIRNGQHEYFFSGDIKDREGKIESFPIEETDRLWPVRSFYLGSVLLQPGLVWILLTKKIDCLILLGNAAWPFTWITALMGRLSGKRVLFWTHGWIKKEGGVKGFVRNSFYRIAQGMLVYGNISKKIGVESKYPEDKIYVVYNSLNFKKQQQYFENVSQNQIAEVKRYFKNPDFPILICCSRLTQTRRLDLLFDAAKILADSGSPVNILLVGDGPETEQLSLLAKKLKLDVKFYGACYDEEMIATMTAASTVTVAPGKVGLTAIHSMTYGTPVISHDNPSEQMPEFEAIVPGVTGDLFTYQSVEDLAQVIKRWTHSSPPSSCENCIRVISDRYTPEFQREIFDAAVTGIPPCQLPMQDRMY